MCPCNKRRVAPVTAIQVRAVAAPASVPDLAPRSMRIAPLATVDTSVWGAILWRALHAASMAADNRSQIDAWHGVAEALRTGLPCPDCSAHYNAWYNAHPLKFSAVVAPTRLMNPMARARVRRTAPAPIQATTVGWVLDLHNNVNQRLGKPEWSFDQVMSAYGDKAAAKAALQALRGVIGDNLFDALSVFLR